MLDIDLRNVGFLILGHRAVRASWPYFGFLDSPISTNYRVGISPKAPTLGLVKLEFRLVGSLIEKS